MVWLLLFIMGISQVAWGQGMERGRRQIQREWQEGQREQPELLWRVGPRVVIDPETGSGWFRSTSRLWEGFGENEGREQYLVNPRRDDLLMQERGHGD